ncbi:MAG: hypothetical protein MJ212_02835, partial [Alphaproteobacteria bacterium]|nr:hypothetical protein [Alphaproteobacteria bacterium]
PYTAALDYTFGAAATEKSSNVGEIKVLEERRVVDHGFEKTKKSFTSTAMTCETVHFVLWSDGTREESHHKWVTPRSLKNGESFSKVCADNTNRTSRPSMETKSSQKTYKDSEGGSWSGIEENSAISATVEFNGASNASLAWTALEMNSVTLKVDEDVLEFGRDGYNFNLNPTLGGSTKSGDYKVYPYTAALDYTFGAAATEKSNNTGTIKVLEETPFFPEEWGKLEKVIATTTLSEDAKDWDYVWSLHFHNASTGKYYVLPVILINEDPDTPVWNFSQVESCSKADYDLYNGAYYYKGVKNAVASDEREWMQWAMTSSTAYGTIKYRTAMSKNWDAPSYVNGHPTVFTKRYAFSIENGRLFASDTYSEKRITDSHCVNGGWK